MSIQRTNKAHIDLNKKLKLERKLYNAIRSVFNDIVARSSVMFFNPASYRNKLSDVIQDHYEDVFSVFGNDYSKSNNIIMFPIQREIMVNDINEQYARHADKQAAIISETNTSQLARCKALARANIEDTDLSYNELVSNLYSAMLLRRVNNIAIYETQWCAEFTKAFEVSYLLGHKGIEVKASTRGAKRWDAVGDDRMRDWHADADSQVVDVDEPFSVGGEELMYPGDTSLGATAMNIINCRCSTGYDLDPASLMTLVDKHGNEISAPAKIVTDEKVITVGRRLDKSIADAMKSGDQAVLAELEKLKVEYDDLMRRHLSGERIPTPKFASIGKRRTALMKGGGIIKPIVVKPLPPVFKPAPLPTVQIQPGVTLKLDDALSKAESEISAFRNAGGQLRTSEIRTELSRLNGINSERYVPNIKFGSKGYGGSAVSSQLPKTTATHSIETATKELFDSGIVNKSLVTDDVKSITFSVEKGLTRAYAQSGQNKIGLSVRSTTPTVAHEIGHHIEFRNSGIQERLVQWRSKRINAAINRGEKAIRLYGDYQPVWEDGFFHPYVGKVYSGGETEVLSMGVEALFDPNTLRELLQKDPEHFQLIWSILRGY